MNDVRLPPGYRLQRDPDVLILRRSDGCFVAAFSVRGTRRENIEQAAREDSRELGGRVRRYQRRLGGHPDDSRHGPPLLADDGEAKEKYFSYARLQTSS